MTRVVEAIYSRGVLEPLEKLDLPERQRVQLTVRLIDGASQAPTNAVGLDSTPITQDREAALNELFAEIDKMNLHLRVRMPTRDELHERR
jgi:predicted DNA-binding antitoxin AbrB/MazE fold protein